MLQPDLSSLLPTAGSCSLQRCSQREASARWHVVEHVRLRRQRPAGGRPCGGRPAAAGVVAAAAAAAAGIPTLSALQLGGSQTALAQQQQGQGEELPAGLDLSLAENDADIVGFLYRQVGGCPAICAWLVQHWLHLAARREFVFGCEARSRGERLWRPVDAEVMCKQRWPSIV